MYRAVVSRINSTEILEYLTASGVKVRVIAGSSNGVSGAVMREVTEPPYLYIYLPAGTVFSTAIPNTHNAFIYVYRGAVKVGEKIVPIKRMGVLHNTPEVDGITLSTTEEARIILISGKPLYESIMQYGPFVMNTQAEIEQALSDFRDGRLA